MLGGDIRRYSPAVLSMYRSAARITSNLIATLYVLYLNKITTLIVAITVIMQALYCVLALGFFSPAISAASPLGEYDVSTTNGKISGHPAPNVRNTAEFLGIPYAQPPVGQLRFAPPLPPDSIGSFVAGDWVCQCLNGQNLTTGTQADFNQQGEYVDQSPMSSAS
jgi:hypothetical protein